MSIGCLQQDGDGPRILALLDEGELVLTENMFIDKPGISEIGLINVLEAIQ